MSKKYSILSLACKIVSKQNVRCLGWVDSKMLRYSNFLCNGLYANQIHVLCNPGSAFLYGLVVNQIFHDTKPFFNPFPNKPWFLHVCSTSLLKTQWEKEKLLLTSNFSFSHSTFHPFRELLAIFIKFEIVVCKLFSVWQSLKSVVWERVTNIP